MKKLLSILGLTLFLFGCVDRKVDQQSDEIPVLTQRIETEIGTHLLPQFKAMRLDTYGRDDLTKKSKLEPMFPPFFVQLNSSIISIEYPVDHLAFKDMSEFLPLQNETLWKIAPKGASLSIDIAVENFSGTDEIENYKIDYFFPIGQENFKMQEKILKHHFSVVRFNDLTNLNLRFEDREVCGKFSADKALGEKPNKVLSPSDCRPGKLLLGYVRVSYSKDINGDILPESKRNFLYIKFGKHFLTDSYNESSFEYHNEWTEPALDPSNDPHGKIRVIQEEEKPNCPSCF